LIAYAIFRYLELTPHTMSNHLLAIGVDQLDQTYYQNRVTELSVCNKDARDVHQFFTETYSFASEKLLENGKSTDVLAHLSALAKQMGEGDKLLLYYSGHGGQVTDLNGDEQFDDYDETWCLHDRQLIDDEIFYAFSKFAAGVTILVLSDSCHSGSITKTEKKYPPESKKVGFEKSQALIDLNPEAHQELANLEIPNEDDVKAGILLISGCQDHESSYTGVPNSQFTQALFKSVKADPQGVSIKQVYKDIRAELEQPYYYQQHPHFTMYGGVKLENVLAAFADFWGMKTAT